jgi:hypothetical protein
MATGEEGEQMTNDEIPKYPKKSEIRKTKAGNAGVAVMADGYGRRKNVKRSTFK